eukprot:symbB.v1.2.027175.t1/scaffold2760.1/size95945/7
MWRRQAVGNAFDQQFLIVAVHEGKGREGKGREGKGREAHLNAQQPKSAAKPVTTDTRVADLNVQHVQRIDDRRIEVIANGLALWGGAQLAVATRLVFPFTRAGERVPKLRVESFGSKQLCHNPFLGEMVLEALGAAVSGAVAMGAGNWDMWGMTAGLATSGRGAQVDQAFQRKHDRIDYKVQRQSLHRDDISDLISLTTGSNSGKVKQFEMIWRVRGLMT